MNTIFPGIHGNSPMGIPGDRGTGSKVLSLDPTPFGGLWRDDHP